MNQPAFDEARGVKLLHLILLGFGVLVALAFVVMVSLRGPILQVDSGTSVIGWSMAGVALITVAFAVLLVRPRVPSRSASTPPAEYWSPATRSPSMLLWILCENAGVIAGLGYLLTGMLVALAVQGIALLALAWYSPSRLADE
jgi:hypothetical protein